MRKETLKRLVLLAVMVLPFCAVAGDGDYYRGKTFWVGFLQSEVGKDPFELSLYITSTEKTSVKVTLPAAVIESREEREWSETYIVTPGSATVVVIPQEYTFKAKNGKSTNKGLYIEADADVMIVAKNSSGASSDATIIIPVKSLGSQYLIMEYAVLLRQYPTQYLVMATEDSTEVELTNPYKSMDGGKSRTPYTIKLNRGEYHVVQSEYDLTGGWVREKNGRKIAVFSGSTCAYVPKYCQSCDHLFEQALPASDWGFEFAVTQFESRDKYVVRVLAKEDNTYVDVNGKRYEILKAGKFLEFELNEAVHIRTSRQAMVAQYSTGTRCDNKKGDPSMVMVRPLLSFSGTSKVPTLSTERVNRFYVTVIAKTEDIYTIKVNGRSIDDYQSLPYKPEYSYARIELENPNNTIECDCQYNYTSYGFGWYESYAY